MLTSSAVLQLNIVEMLVPTPRSCVGKISESMSEKIGPIPMANEKMYTNKQISMRQPALVAFKRKIVPIRGHNIFSYTFPR